MVLVVVIAQEEECEVWVRRMREGGEGFLFLLFFFERTSGHRGRERRCGCKSLAAFRFAAFRFTAFRCNNAAGEWRWEQLEEQLADERQAVGAVARAGAGKSIN